MIVVGLQLGTVPIVLLAALFKLPRLRGSLPQTLLACWFYILVVVGVDSKGSLPCVSIGFNFLSFYRKVAVL